MYEDGNRRKLIIIGLLVLGLLAIGLLFLIGRAIFSGDSSSNSNTNEEASSLDDRQSIPVYIISYQGQTEVDAVRAIDEAGGSSQVTIRNGKLLTIPTITEETLDTKQIFLEVEDGVVTDAYYYTANE